MDWPGWVLIASMDCGDNGGTIELHVDDRRSA